MSANQEKQRTTKAASTSLDHREPPNDRHDARRAATDFVAHVSETHTETSYSMPNEGRDEILRASSPGVYQPIGDESSCLMTPSPSIYDLRDPPGMTPKPSGPYTTVYTKVKGR